MHVTDVTNASRTSLYNIHENDWDDDLLALFNVPRSGLPQVMDCAAEFGTCDPTCSTPNCRSAVLPVTSRPRPLARAVLSPARLNPPMAQDVLSSLIPARTRWPPKTSF